MQIKNWLGLFFVLCLFRAAAQPAEGNAGPGTSSDSLLQIDVRQEAVSLPLYNGRRFYGYEVAIVGRPYYRYLDWEEAKVHYEDTWYVHVPVMYDTYRDELIVRHPSGNPLIPFSERIKEFVIDGMSFVYMRKPDVPKEGFYEVLAKGAMTVLAARRNLLDEKAVNTTLVRKFIPQDTYYVLLQGKKHTIENKNSLMSLTGSDRQRIQQDLREKDLNYKRQQEATIVRVAELYNQLHPSL